MAHASGLLEPKYDEMSASDIVTMNQDLAAALGVDVQPRTPAPPGDLVSAGFGRAGHLYGNAVDVPPEVLAAAAQPTLEQACEALRIAPGPATTVEGEDDLRTAPPSQDDLKATPPSQALQQVTALLSPLLD